MFFILSKTLNFLAMPLTIVFIFFILSFFVKRQPWKKRFYWTGFILLLFFSNDYIANEVMRVWEVDAIAFKDMHSRAVGIVLTGTTQSFIQPDDRVYFQKGADRVTHTIQLYKLGLIRKILISGGIGRILKGEEPEADKYKRVMLMAGVNEADIIIENETRNTYESAVAVRKMLDSLQYKKDDCVLITSAFHMRRSMACYRKAGIPMEAFTVDFYGTPDKHFFPNFFVPTSYGFIIWEKLFKEWVGFIAYKLAGYI